MVILYRFLIVWVVLHIILFFVERYRFRHSDLSWYGFKSHGMLDITYFVLVIDRLGIEIAILGGLIYWIIQPLI